MALVGESSTEQGVLALLALPFHGGRAGSTATGADELCYADRDPRHSRLHIARHVCDADEVDDKTLQGTLPGAVRCMR